MLKKKEDEEEEEKKIRLKMASFPIARLYYSLPFLFPLHSAAQDLGQSPDVLPKAACG